MFAVIAVPFVATLLAVLLVGVLLGMTRAGRATGEIMWVALVIVVVGVLILLYGV